MRPKISAAALLTVILGSILRAAAGLTFAGWIAAAALLVYLVLEGRAVRRNSRIILASAFVAAIAALFHPTPLALLEKAGVAAGALIGLFTALGFLREAAETSIMVQRCGELMVKQPPGRRYLVLTFGAHLISLVLNFGVLPLLGTMIVKGNTLEAAAGKADIVAVRAQRMLSAMLRGFAVMTAWSPLSVSFAVTMAVIPGLNWLYFLPLQILLALILLFLGQRLDRRRFPPAAQSLPGIGGKMDSRPLWAMIGLVAAVVTASIIVAELLSVRLVIGAMIAVPASALIWLWLQHKRLSSALAFLRKRLPITLPAFRDEAAMLGGAMFAGTILAAFIPPHHVAQLLETLSWPPVIILILLCWAVMALAQIGVSQIVTVTVFGGALADMAGHGLSPLVSAAGLMGAWALSACSTPVGAAVLTIARIGQVPVSTVARDWNGRFVLSGAVVLSLWLAALSAIMDFAAALR
jgi:hypothetical protein